MERVIKFECFYGGKMHGHLEALRLMYNEANGSTLNPKDVKYREFTGLHDKNGKEVFEGDIITCEIYQMENYDEHYSGKPIQVRWSEKDAGFYPFTKASGWRSSVENIEVIGNIFENKNLLD